MRVPGRCTGTAIIVLIFLGLGGCSSTRMAYRYADWGIVWWVEDYVTLNDAQLSQLESDIEELRQWHCSEELPRYTDWLGNLENAVKAGDLDRDRIARQQLELFQGLERLLVAVTPTATDLLASLNDEQVAELEESMAEDQREKEEKYLEPDPQEQRLARAERIRERAVKWLGELNSRQRQLIATWNRSRGDQTRVWLESRERWQEALLDELSRRDSPDFPQRIETLLQDRGQFMGEDYRAMAANSQQALVDLTFGLLDAADASQRRHLTSELADLRRDFEALSCQAGD